MQSSGFGSSNPNESPFDSLGLIWDRAARPARLLGQATLIAKNKIATPASAVFNYLEFPYALSIELPNPDLWYTAKAINLHPEFELNKAKTQYQIVSGSAIEAPYIYEHDLAIITLDPVIPELTQEQIVSINSQLSIKVNLPYQLFGGNFQTHDLFAAIRSSISSGKDGLLIFLDERNKPFARLEIKEGRILKVIYKNFVNEFAVFELACRRIPGSFIFQSPGSYEFPEWQDMSSPAESLLNEAARRAAELPQLVASLGGPDIRFVRNAETYDPALLHPSFHWVADRIWQSLDGYITVDKLSERMGADIYSIVRVVMELQRLGLIAPARHSPFSKSGRLGSPFGAEVDASLWDQLKALYLDPLSKAPVTVAGNFLGTTRLLEQDTLIHTIPLPPEIHGAAILRAGKLLGLSAGPYIQPPGSQPLPLKASRMCWLGTMSELSLKPNKKLAEAMSHLEEQREEEALLAASGSKRPAISGSVHSSRRMQEDSTDGEDNQPKFSLTTHADMLTAKQKKIIFGGAIGAFVLFILFILWPKAEIKAPQTTAPVAVSPTAGLENSPEAEQIAQNYGFTSQIPSGYVFEDTSKVTGGLPSFGLISSLHNQRIICVVWNNQSPANNIEILTHKPPFTPYENEKIVKDIKVEEGESAIGNGTMPWFAGRYKYKKDDKEVKQIALIGAFKLPGTEKCIVVIARPYTDSELLDYQTSLFVINSLGQSMIKTSGQSNGNQQGSVANNQEQRASAEDIEAYRQNVENLLLSSFDPSKYDKKLKCTIQFQIAANGQIKKIEIKKSSGDEACDQALLRAIDKHAPYSGIPNTTEGGITFKAIIDGGTLKLESI